MNRLYTIDMFRIMCAVAVFMFHAHISVDIYTDFGFLNSFISYGHIFMIAFFMLSGFALYYVDYEKRMANNTSEGGGKCIGKFYWKRLAGIYPLYFVCAAAYIICYNNLSFIQNLVLIPLEVSLLQSVYQGSFYVSHFGGTWFISNLFICYLLFPFLKDFLNKNLKRTNIILLIIIWLFLSYSFVVIYFFKFSDVYTNPVIRFLEFFVGMIIADFFEKNKQKNISKWISLLIPFIGTVFIVIITIVVHFKRLPLDCFTVFAIPAFGSILYLCARLETIYGFKFCRKVILILSENTYAFFLAQFFTWSFVKNINNLYLNLNNKMLFVLCFAWCGVITVFMHYCIERPCKKLVLSFKNRRINTNEV